MLRSDEVKRIGSLWQPAEWPDGTDAYAKVGYRRSFGYHLERIRHLGLSGDLLIDAGCGGGRWSFAWAATFERVIGFDMASRRLAAATWQKERLDVPAVEFVVANLEKIPADDESAEALYCNDVINGAYPIKSAMREFARVLKPGGICYLGLTGLGVAYEQMKGDNPKLAVLGRGRIYHTLCERHLTSLIGAIAPGGARNLRLGAQLTQEMRATELLSRLNCRPDQIMAAETIANDLGDEFSRLLLDDLVAISAGEKANFGDGGGGRCWDADEVSVAARKAGFDRSEWAPDSWLSLRPNSEIEKAPSARARPGPPEFEGKSRFFEMLLWKPSKKKARAIRQTGMWHEGRVRAAEPELKPGAEWKLKIGGTTYWNATPKEILLPIIDPGRPVSTELEEAIITPREIDPKIDGPKSGRLREAKGGVYDRNRNLLPVFLEREAFEASVNKGNRLKNDPVLSSYDLNNSKRLWGKYIYLGILRNHFGHFLLESLCRVWYLLKRDPDAKILLYYDFNIEKVPSYIQFIFELLDISLDKLVVVKGPVLVDHLIFPQSEFEIRWRAHSSYADTFRELFERSSRKFPVGATPNRIYLTRRQLNIENSKELAKVVSNEEEVESIFCERGFTIVAPEKIPFHAQIALAAGAGQIAGLKGSALHMSLFCQRPKVRIIQIGQKQSMNQALIDGLKNVDAHQIFCASAPTEAGSVVDLEVIRAAVREM